MPNLAFPMAKRFANVDRYQTYAISMSGTKRKLMAVADDSGSLGSHQHSNKQASSKKTCRNNDSYNPKFMAHMCFAAHMERLHAAAMASYPWHVKEDYQQDLGCMFANAYSKGSFRYGTAARHLIPRLAGIAPRSKHDKAALVREFIQDYDNVRCDLLQIQYVMSSSSRDDLDLITVIRNCVASLHVTLRQSTRWHTIMPYTPLPKACLSKLRNFVTDPKQNHLVSDLEQRIIDVENWLSLPFPLIEFPARLIAPVIERLDRPEKSTDKPEAGLLAQTDTCTQGTANIEEQKTKQMHRLEEQLRDQKTQKDLLETRLKRAQAEHVRLTDRVKALELAMAARTTKYKEERGTWTASAAEIEQSYSGQITERNSEIDHLNTVAAEIEKRHSDQIIQRDSQIDRLNATPSAERERSASIEAGAAWQLAQVTVPTDTSVSVSSGSDLTTDNSFTGNASSSSTFPSEPECSYANTQLHSFQQVTAPVIHQDPLTVVEEVAVDSEIDIIEQPQTTTLAGSSHSSSTDTGHFGQCIKNAAGVAPSQNEVFNPACRNFKLGRCTRGENCRFPHTACRHWLRDNCKHQENCRKSHDLFFLEKANLRPRSSRGPHSDHVATNNNLHQDLNPVVLDRQIDITQPSMEIEYAQSFAPTAPKALLTHSRMQHDESHTHKPYAHACNLEKGGSLTYQPHPEPDLSQGLRQLNQRKKQACQNYLENRCTEGQHCKYAHFPCSFFIRGTCKFTDQTCKMSHDPLFIALAAPSTRTQFASSQYSNPPKLYTHFEDLDEIIQLGKQIYKKSRNPLFITSAALSTGRQHDVSQQSNSRELQLHLENSDKIIQLDGQAPENSHDLTQAASSTRLPYASSHHIDPANLELHLQNLEEIIQLGKIEKPGVVSVPNTPCRWQKTPTGCTNTRYEYKHDPPKAMAKLE